MITVIPRKITATSVSGVTVANDGNVALTANDIPISAQDSTKVAAAIGGKVDKDQGVANAGKALGIGNDGIVTPVPFSGTDFTGATASAAGIHGYVPAPAAGDQGKFLKGDGSWDNVPVMDGASSVSAGASGLVPAPTAADYNKVLKGNGAWATVPGTANEMPMSSSDNTTVKEAIDKLGQFTSISGSTKSSIQNNLATFASNLTDGSIAAIKFSVGSNPDAPFETTTYVGTLYKAGTRLFVRVQGITKISQDLNGYYREGYAWVWNSFNLGISEINNSLSIVEDGDTATQTIAKGQYVIWHGALYTADAAIASGTTLAASGGNKNLTMAENGGLNSLSNKLPKAGYKSITIPAGGSQSVTVLFDTAFPAGTSYSVQITQADQYAYADLFFGSTDRSVNGFKLNGSSSRTASITLQVMWAAIPF